MIRKTDDELILKMLNEGKTQKEIAEYFGVSPVAIHKRVKKLVPPPETPHFNNLTEKEQKFAIEKAKGSSNIVAAMNSYDVTSRESAKAMGSQLMAKPEVDMAIKELMNYHGISKFRRVERLGDHIEHPDPNVSLKALDQSWKLDGSYEPEETRDSLSYQEMIEMVDKLDKTIAIYEKELMLTNDSIENWRKEGLTDTEIVEKIITEIRPLLNEDE